ncbi:MAG: hypothetical protein D6680_12680 [Cyanobacteria bacterium J007]|nr:MAG: hypothetical protein D6680_12680 [Cyanobacteria bacterium J007]
MGYKPRPDFGQLSHHLGRLLDRMKTIRNPARVSRSTGGSWLAMGGTLEIAEGKVVGLPMKRESPYL